MLTRWAKRPSLWREGKLPMMKLIIASAFGCGFVLIGYVGVMRALTMWLTACVLLSALVPLSPVLVNLQEDEDSDEDSGVNRTPGGADVS